MNILFKLAICIACCNFIITGIQAQENVSSEQLYSKYLSYQPASDAINGIASRPVNNPFVKFTMDESFNIFLDNASGPQHLKKAILNFSSQNFMSSKFIAAPIDPTSALLHDDSHVVALQIHAGNTFPLLLKFALYY